MPGEAYRIVDQIAEQADAVISSPVLNQALLWNGTKWANTTLISGLTVDGAPDGAADYVMTYDASAGMVKRVLLNNLPGGGGGGANTALSNLVSVAINTSLISDTDITDDLGTGEIRWRDIYAETLNAGTTAADTLKLRGRDTDGGSWVDVLTITSGDTVAADLDSIVTIGGNAILDATWTGSGSITTVGTLSSGNATAIVDAATQSVAGKVELATVPETNTGADDTRAVTPVGLAGWTGSGNVTTVGTLASGDATAIVSAASDTVAGKVELATIAETNTGTDATRAVTPDGLNDWTGSGQITTVGTLASGDATAIVSAASDTVAGKVELATIAETNTGTATNLAVTPDGLDGWTGSGQVTTVGTLASGDATAIVSAATTTLAGKVELATTAETNTGTDTDRAVTPAALTGWTGSTNIATVGTVTAGTWSADLAADTVDAITEIAAGLRSGSDVTLITGTAGTAGNLLEWNGDGDAVEASLLANQLLGRYTASTGDIQKFTDTDLTEEGAPASGDFLLGWTSEGNLRKFDVGDLPTGGGGEANTASNGGTGGIGITLTKSGIDLPFKSMFAASSRISVADGGGNDRVEFDVPAASDTVAGAVELATIAETNTGTDTTRAVTPDGLDGWTGSAQVATVGTITSGTWSAYLAADTVDAITEIAAGLRSGSDTTLVTGTAGTSGNLAEWNGDGDLVESSLLANQLMGRYTASTGDVEKFTDTELTEEGAPAAGDFLLGWTSEGNLRKFDVGDLPTGGGGSVATDAIWDATGDIAVGTGANTAAVVSIGSNGNFARVSGGTFAWSTAASSDLSDSANITLLNGTQTNTAVKSFNSGTLKLNGATSGSATLNAPAVAATNVYTLPSATSTLATLALAETFTNKTWGSGTVIGANISSTASRTFSLNAASTTVFTINNTNGSNVANVDIDGRLLFRNGTSFTMTLSGTPTANRTITFQNVDHTVVGRNTTDTLTAKTLTAPVINGVVTTTGLTLPGHTVNGNVTYSGAITVDAGGITSFEIPNSAAPSLSAAGQIALDTDVTSHSALLKYHDGTNEFIVPAIRTSDLTTTDNHVIAYSSASGRFVMEAAAGGGGATLSNGVNNRVVTALDASDINGEANLTFDGSTLALTGNLTISKDATFGTEISNSHASAITVDLTDANHQTIDLGSTTTTATVTVTPATGVGSGSFIVKQHASSAKDITSWTVTGRTVIWQGGEPDWGADAAGTWRIVSWRDDGTRCFFASTAVNS